jgi:hypothetical protein
MERIICNRIDWMLETGNLLSRSQTGFRKFRSTYDQLTCLEYKIQHALQMREHCMSLFLDLSGAFDAVWYMAVLYKMTEMGFRGRLMGWLQSYLSGREFHVSFEGAISESKKATSGLPQGAIISPVLFNILMQDLPQREGISYYIFADDVALYCSGPNLPAIVDQLQLALSEIEQWMALWGQRLNTGKTRSLYFGERDAAPPPLYVGGNKIDYVQSYKFLGVTFDSPKLTWGNYVNKVNASCNKTASIIKSVSGQRWGSDRVTMLMLYKVLIRSKIDYACHLYNSAADAVTRVLDVTQNQRLRLCMGAR